MDQKNSHISCGGVSLTTGARLTLPLPVLGLFKVEVFMPISQKNAASGRRERFRRPWP